MGSFASWANSSSGTPTNGNSNSNVNQPAPVKQATTSSPKSSGSFASWANSASGSIQPPQPVQPQAPQQNLLQRIASAVSNAFTLSKTGSTVGGKLGNFIKTGNASQQPDASTPSGKDILKQFIKPSTMAATARDIPGAAGNVLSGIGHGIISPFVGVAHAPSEEDASQLNTLNKNELSKQENAFKTNPNNNTSTAYGVGSTIGGIAPYLNPITGAAAASNQLLSSRTPTQVVGNVVNLLLSGGLADKAIEPLLQNATLIRNITKLGSMGYTPEQIVQAGLQNLSHELPDTASAITKALRLPALAKSSAEGAVYGGAGALGTGETNPKEILKQAGQGAIAGPVISIAGAGASDLVSKFMNRGKTGTAPTAAELYAKTKAENPDKFLPTPEVKPVEVPKSGVMEAKPAETPVKTAEIATKPTTHIVEETLPNGTKTGEKMTVTIPDSKTLSDISSRREALKSQGTGLVTNKGDIVVKDSSGTEVSRMTYDKAVQKFGTTDREQLASALVNGQVEAPVMSTKPSLKTVEPTKIEPTGETVRGTSKVANTIESKAIEKGLTDSFEGKAGYDKITIKDQANRASEVMKNMDNARAMIRGEVPVEPGLKPEALLVSMQKEAERTGNVDMMKELASSPLTSGTSAHAQAMRLLAEQNPDSAVAKMKQVKDARIEAKGGEEKVKAKVKQTVKEGTDVIKQAAPKAKDWSSFLDEIRCK